MLVVKDGCRPAVLLEDLDHLLEELVAWVFLLPDLVVRVIAVLTDDQDSVYREPVRATAQGLGNRGIDREPGILRSLPAQVVLWELIHVGGNHVERRTVPLALDRVACQEPFAHVPGMGPIPPLGGHNRHLLASFFRLLAGHGGTRDEARCPRTQEASSCDHGCPFNGSFGAQALLALGSTAC